MLPQCTPPRHMAPTLLTVNLPVCPLRSVIAAVLGDAGVSIDRMNQYGHADTSAPVVIVTHKITRTALDEALEAMAKTSVVLGDPVAIRIEEVD